MASLTAQGYNVAGAVLFHNAKICAGRWNADRQ